MKKSLILFSIILVITLIAIVYFTHVYQTTGVPFYRHNEVYDIMQQLDSNVNNDIEKNYTEPFKKYGTIGVDEIGIDNYKDSVNFAIKESTTTNLQPK